MKFLLLISFYLTTAFAFAQAPTIEGDVMLCPNTNGTATITNNTTYTSYQWYSKYWFTNDPYVAIDGATSASFTYDWMTYDQSLLKVVVTLNGTEYESNAIQVDSYAWASITVMNETTGNVVFNPDQGFILCEGGTITNTISSPYTLIQWYKNGVAIEGATSTTLVINSPGSYYAIAAPPYCPNSTSTTLPIDVVAGTNCAQQVIPVIAGDVMLCPGSEGTALEVNGINYNSYQWLVKFDGEDTFSPVSEETAASFTYDAFTYSVSQIKLAVTLDGQSYQSNVLSIDGYTWSSIFVITDINSGVTFNPDSGSYLLCEGGAITNTIDSPYTIIQWYKDEVAIDGATEAVFEITSPGTYYAIAAPDYCPNSTSNTLPVVVSNNPDCTAGIDNPTANAVTLYPNPANSQLNLNLAQSSALQEYIIFDVTGKNLMSGKLNASLNTINIAGLSVGSYIIKLLGEQAQTSKMFIKQ